MRIHVRTFAVAALSLFVVACGSDSVGPSTLSEAEAQELASAIFSQSLFGALATDFQQPAQAPGGPQLAMWSSTIEATGPCPSGGQISLNGSVDAETDDQTGAGSFDFALTIVHIACVVQGEMGTVFTLDGNPSLLFDFFMSTDGAENFAFDGGLSGAVDWARDGASGTCSIGYEFSGETLSDGSLSMSVAGNVCGNAFTQNITISA